MMPKRKRGRPRKAVDAAPTVRLFSFRVGFFYNDVQAALDQYFPDLSCPSLAQDLDYYLASYMTIHGIRCVGQLARLQKRGRRPHTHIQIFLKDLAEALMRHGYAKAVDDLRRAKWPSSSENMTLSFASNLLSRAEPHLPTYKGVKRVGRSDLAQQAYKAHEAYFKLNFDLR